jgi:predicted DNA-binding antitoxin AbrB/MazE fold protein
MGANAGNSIGLRYNGVGVMKRTHKASITPGLPNATFRARFSRGALRPLERVSLREGEEVSVAVLPTDSRNDDWLRKTAGGWAGLIDCERLKENIYKDRLVRSRRKARL